MHQAFKQWGLRLYRIGLRLGVHLIPVHPYAPLSDLRFLKKNKEIWAKKSQLKGIDSDLAPQITHLTRICVPYQEEYLDNEIYQKAVQQKIGSGYGYIEAQALHGVIRFFQPKRVIEIGSGISTYCLLKALEYNQAETHIAIDLTTIDPHPSLGIQNLLGINLKQDIVQRIDLTFFAQLQANDLLFIDSSHTVKIAGDVNYLILEVLPRLNSGVIVHFHDIFLPYDYPRNALQTFFPWLETALLKAFLINNTKVKILFCLSQLHYESPQTLKKVFPTYQPQLDENGLRDKYYKPFENPQDEHFPSSIYLQIQ